MYREERMMVRKLAAEQHGAVSWDQVLDAGLPPRTAARWLASSAWERVEPEVFRVAGSPVTWHQRVMIACLTVGTGTVASHRAAAALQRLKGFGPATIDVTIERWKRRERGRVRVHESKDLAPHDVTVVDGIPCTTVPRTLIDLGAVTHEVKVARALDELRRDDPGVLAEVRSRNAALSRRGRRGCGVMNRILETRPGGNIPSKSQLEDLFYELFLAHGVRLERNVEGVEGDRRAYIDLASPPHRYGIEIDSEEHHLDQERFVADRRRNNWIRRLWHIDQYTYADYRDRRLEVVHEVLAYLRDGKRP
jgi:predicted transcriptional regulator of viral defense system